MFDLRHIFWPNLSFRSTGEVRPRADGFTLDARPDGVGEGQVRTILLQQGCSNLPQGRVSATVSTVQLVTNPTLRFPTLALPYHILPYPTPYPYPTLPYPTLTLSYLPYPTLPYPTPYPLP